MIHGPRPQRAAGGPGAVLWPGGFRRRRPGYGSRHHRRPAHWHGQGHETAHRHRHGCRGGF